MARSIAQKTARPARRVTVEQLAFPTARGAKASHGLQAAILTMMTACAGFAFILTNLPHGGF